MWLHIRIFIYSQCYSLQVILLHWVLRVSLDVYCWYSLTLYFCWSAHSWLQQVPFHCTEMVIIYQCIWLYSGTPLNGHRSTADTYDITDNSESPDCPLIHSLQYLSNPWIADTPLLCITDSFRSPNCMQTILNDSISGHSSTVSAKLHIHCCG